MIAVLFLSTTQGSVRRLRGFVSRGLLVRLYEVIPVTCTESIPFSMPQYCDIYRYKWSSLKICSAARLASRMFA